MSAPTFRLLVIGRVHGVTRRRLDEACRRAGGRLAARPGPGVDKVAIGEGTARALIRPGPALALPAGLRAGVEVVSEAALKRALGLSPPSAEEPRTLGAAEVARAAGVSEAALSLLGLYAVVEPADGLYGFRDLLAARAVGRLTAAGHDLATVLEAAVMLRRAGRSLSDLSLGADADDVAEAIATRVGGLTGQFTLALGDRPDDEDDLFARAEAAEAAGDLAGAERLYRLIARLDRADPVIPFNLGNVLAAAGRPLEAALAYREALARDAGFAEAALNLAVLAEERGRPDEAARAYDQALAARPAYADALYSAALFHARTGSPDEAAALWERFLATSPPPTDAALARRQLRAARDEAGRRPASAGEPRS